MIRLVALDLDGTLMDDAQKIDPRVRRAIALAQQRGVTITLATGRMFAAARPFAESLHITAPLICYQGGWIQAISDVAPRYRRGLPPDVAQDALHLGDTQAWHAVLYADGHLYLREIRYPMDFYHHLLGYAPIIGVPWADVLAAHQPDKVLFVAEVEAVPLIAARLRTHFKDRAEIVRSHDRFVEVVPIGVDKGKALAWLAHHLNIPRHQVMAVGDQENDLPMIRWAGTGVAMGNAAPAVREAAHWIAPSIAEAGVATILQHFILDAEAQP